MPAALPIQLRQRVVNAYNEKGGYHKIAKQFDVAVITVRRFVAQEKESGCLLPRVAGGRMKPKILPEQYDELELFVQKHSDWTIEEMAEEWSVFTGTHLASSSFSRALKRADLTYKKNLSCH